MNFLVRFKNPAFVIPFIGTVVAFIYQIMGMFGVVPPIAEDQIMQFTGVLVNILVGLGVLVDPTTKGVGDSDRALTYTEPN